MRIGRVDVDPVIDARGLIGEFAELYPDIPAEAWEPFRELYPELFAGASWRLLCTCYVIRADGVTLLVDTGVGPPGLWGWRPESEGGLVPGLAALGVEPADVDVVFLTHVHIDHIGWNADAEGTPFFPDARYLMHPDGIMWALEARPDAPVVQRCLRSLTNGGFVDDVAAGEELVPGVVTVDLPGHLPGHLGLRIGDEAFLISDAAVHPALLEEPDWGYVSDHDQEQSANTRRLLLEELVDSDLLVVCGHYPAGGIGRVRTRADRVLWEASPI